jgi:hypothetical protein
VTDGWITPNNPDVAADYWVTRRAADAAPGYGHDLPDIRVRYRWTGSGAGAGAWVNGYYQDIQGRQRANLVCLHPANGWRIEGPAQ